MLLRLSSLWNCKFSDAHLRPFFPCEYILKHFNRCPAVDTHSDLRQWLGILPDDKSEQVSYKFPAAEKVSMTEISSNLLL